jgi:hypothetical protein
LGFKCPDIPDIKWHWEGGREKGRKGEREREKIFGATEALCTKDGK